MGDDDDGADAGSVRCGCRVAQILERVRAHGGDVQSDNGAVPEPRADSDGQLLALVRRGYAQSRAGACGCGLKLRATHRAAGDERGAKVTAARLTKRDGATALATG